MPDEPRSRIADQIDLAAKVAALRRPETYPDRPARVETIETHRSWIFLTDRLAYKLKKPLRYNAVDVRSLAARRAHCEEEVRLNRRLAGAVYRGVVALTAEPDGRLVIGGRGEPVEWLVAMQRLPADRMLDVMLRHGTADDAAVRRAAAVLARFYRDSPPVLHDPVAYRAWFAAEIRINHATLTPAELGLPAELLRKLRDAQLALLQREPDLFDRRVLAGRIVEGHGDLRPQHICLLEPPVIFDCLEFDRRLRIVDPVDELGFLGMECERIGAPWVGPVVLATYAALTGDRPPARLVAFYQSFRATLWARLAMWRTAELDRSAWGPWLDRARGYLLLAQRHSERLRSR
ncbi:MAG: hypothetical protein QJR03_06230 [Sphaerobacter sp.]|nr:hypothetical protein [Sphaerobacter sp.]